MATRTSINHISNIGGKGNIVWGYIIEKNANEGEQNLHRCNYFLKIDTDGDKTRGTGSLFQYFTTRIEKAPLLR